MKVTIVAKTKYGNDVCVGGLGPNGESIRLMDANGDFPSASTYSIGEEWEVKYKTPDDAEPPHLEDAWVQAQKRVGKQVNLKKHINSLVTPWSGGVDSLFEGKLRFTAKGRGYIGKSDIPSRSTWFWTPNEDLIHLSISGKSYYRCGSRDMSYAGVATPLAKIPKGTLVRVSLARWWRIAEDSPYRCYLQVSGWYL